MFIPNLFSRDNQTECINDILASDVRDHDFDIGESLRKLRRFADSDQFLEKVSTSDFVKNAIVRSKLLCASQVREFSKPLGVIADKQIFEEILFVEGRRSLLGIIKTCHWNPGIGDIHLDTFEAKVITPIFQLLHVYDKMISPDGVLPLGLNSSDDRLQPQDFPSSIATENMTFIFDPKKSLALYVFHPVFKSCENMYGGIALWQRGWRIFPKMDSRGTWNVIQKRMFQVKNKTLRMNRSGDEFFFEMPYGLRRIVVSSSFIQINDVKGRKTVYAIGKQEVAKSVPKPKEKSFSTHKMVTLNSGSRTLLIDV